MSKSTTIGPRPPSTLYGMAGAPDFSGVKPPSLTAVPDARSRLEGRRTGGRSLTDSVYNRRLGEIPARGKALTRPALRRLDEQFAHEDRKATFAASRGGKFGGASHLAERRDRKRSQADRRQGAIAEGIAKEQQMLGSLGDWRASEMAASERGERTGVGGGRAGYGGLGIAGFGPISRVKKDKAVTTKKKVEEKPVVEEGGGGTGGHTGGDMGMMAG